jgi:hypothetical protein
MTYPVELKETLKSQQNLQTVYVNEDCTDWRFYDKLGSGFKAVSRESILNENGIEPSKQVEVETVKAETTKPRRGRKKSTES